MYASQELQTLESRAIGAPISHAEEGLYCRKRHGESISQLTAVNLLWKEVVGVMRICVLPLFNTERFDDAVEIF
jgi:hypothetical protein